MSAPILECYFHMSTTVFNVGDTGCGNGQNKVDERIEDPLEKARPSGMLDRRNAVYMRSIPDFSRCGIINSGYIYRVRPSAAPQMHDLSWIGDMQKALLKQKYPHLCGMQQYPTWSEKLVACCVAAYWTQEPSPEPVWEGLAASFEIIEQLTPSVVQASSTAGGWSRLE